MVELRPNMAQSYFALRKAQEFIGDFDGAMATTQELYKLGRQQFQYHPPPPPGKKE